MIIGVPIYNDKENLLDMIESLIDSTQYYNKIILLDSSTDDTTDICMKLKEAYSNIEVIRIPKEGPLKAYNRLFQIAKDKKEDLFLTQTDVLFPKCHNRDWLKQMRDVSMIDECGIVTCLGGGGQSGPDFIDNFYWVGAWCTYIPYRTIEKIGGYDENIPLGYGVDIDYTYAIKQAGLKVYYINYWVDHHPDYSKAHEHERVEDFEQLKKDAFIYMRKKWKVGEFKNVMD